VGIENENDNCNEIKILNSVEKNEKGVSIG
jgi:hypothetical protein